MPSKTTTHGAPRLQRQPLSGPIFNFNALYKGKTSKYNTMSLRTTRNSHSTNNTTINNTTATTAQQPNTTRYKHLGICLPILLLAPFLFLCGQSPASLVQRGTQQPFTNVLTGPYVNASAFKVAAAANGYCGGVAVPQFETSNVHYV